jgi:hypothetical protein
MRTLAAYAVPIVALVVVAIGSGIIVPESRRGGTVQVAAPTADGEVAGAVAPNDRGPVVREVDPRAAGNAAADGQDGAQRLGRGAEVAVWPAQESTGDAQEPEATDAIGPFDAAESEDGAEESALQVQAASPNSPAMGRIQPPRGYRAASLHRQPSIRATRVALVPAGSYVELLGGTARGDGYTWTRVRTASGREGWLIAAAIRRQ